MLLKNRLALDMIDIRFYKVSLSISKHVMSSDHTFNFGDVEALNLKRIVTVHLIIIPLFDLSHIQKPMFCHLTPTMTLFVNAGSV